MIKTLEEPEILQEAHSLMIEIAIVREVHLETDSLMTEILEKQVVQPETGLTMIMTSVELEVPMVMIEMTTIMEFLTETEMMIIEVTETEDDLMMISMKEENLTVPTSVETDKNKVQLRKRETKRFPFLF